MLQLQMLQKRRDNLQPGLNSVFDVNARCPTESRAVNAEYSHSKLLGSNVEHSAKPSSCEHTAAKEQNGIVLLAVRFVPAARVAVGYSRWDFSISNLTRWQYERFVELPICKVFDAATRSDIQ